MSLDNPIMHPHAPRPVDAATVDDVNFQDLKEMLIKAFAVGKMIDDQQGGTKHTITALKAAAKENKRLWDLMVHRAMNMEREYAALMRRPAKRSGQ